MKYLRLEEVRHLYGVGREELERLDGEGLIRIKRTLEDEVVVSDRDADVARLVSVLMKELGVNLPGVEVIVHMRAEMLAMQRQFGRILEELVAELREGLRPH